VGALANQASAPLQQEKASHLVQLQGAGIEIELRFDRGIAQAVTRKLAEILQKAISRLRNGAVSIRHFVLVRSHLARQ
jgi:hypothetical protein